MKSQEHTPATPIEHHLESILALLESPRNGLPLNVFHFVSQLTPLINVDLLVRNAAGETLLTWRHDEFYGPGWHIPGGIIRFKEYAADRIAKVADIELGANVDFDPTPLTMLEKVAPHRDIRGHFISLLYRCTLTSPLRADWAFNPDNPVNGHWAWFKTPPTDLIPVHHDYAPFITPDFPGDSAP